MKSMQRTGNLNAAGGSVDEYKHFGKHFSIIYQPEGGHIAQPSNSILGDTPLRRTSHIHCNVYTSLSITLFITSC